MATDKIVNKEIAAGAPPAMKKSPARQRRSSEAARENILRASERLLTERGPQALKLAEVAASAGVATATVMHHFGSVDGVQKALMEHMISDLVVRVIAINDALPPGTPPGPEGARALFDAFEAPGAARLAAWLVLTGEAPRLDMVRAAVDEVITRIAASRPLPVPREAMVDILLGSITMALGAGLFGPSLSGLLDRPGQRAREVLLALLTSQMQQSGFA